MENQDIPDKIKRHLKELLRFSNLPLNNESLTKMAELWHQKEKIFIEETYKYNLNEIDYLDQNDPRGALLMTYSGSILKIGPAENNFRRVEYTSIGLRKDVPETKIFEQTVLAYDIIQDEPIDFKEGKLKATSPVFKISVCKADTTEKEQNQNINDAADYIINNFIELNSEIYTE